LGIWIARKPPGFGFILMGSHRDAKDACEGLNNSKIGPYMQVEMATNDMKGSKPSSYIDSSRSRGSATRYRSRSIGAIPGGMIPKGMTREGRNRGGMTPDEMTPEGRSREGMIPEGMTQGRVMEEIVPGEATLKGIKAEKSGRVHLQGSRERTVASVRPEIGRVGGGIRASQETRM